MIKARKGFWEVTREMLWYVDLLQASSEPIFRPSPYPSLDKIASTGPQYLERIGNFDLAQ
jgi:hypothetical protein